MSESPAATVIDALIAAFVIPAAANGSTAPAPDVLAAMECFIWRMQPELRLTAVSLFGNFSPPGGGVTSGNLLVFWAPLQDGCSTSRQRQTLAGIAAAALACALGRREDIGVVLHAGRVVVQNDERGPAIAGPALVLARTLAGSVTGVRLTEPAASALAIDRPPSLVEHIEGFGEVGLIDLGSLDAFGPPTF